MPLAFGGADVHTGVLAFVFIKIFKKKKKWQGQQFSQAGVMTVVSGFLSLCGQSSIGVYQELEAPQQEHGDCPVALVSSGQVSPPSGDTFITFGN